MKEEMLGLQERWITSKDLALMGKSALQHGPNVGIVKKWPGFKRTSDNKPTLHDSLIPSSTVMP